MQGSSSECITHKLPIDSEGFTQSFNFHDFDPKVVGEFYRKYGLVIFNDVLSQEEVELSVGDLWREVSQITEGVVKREDPNTWKFGGSLGCDGFVNDKPNSQPQLWKNRSHPNVYNTFKKMYEISSGEELNQPLLCLFDRGSMLRPSKINPRWRTENIYHFDIDPWEWTSEEKETPERWRQSNQYCSEFEHWLGEGNYVPKVKNYTKLQGVLALSKTEPGSGGFQVVCGFQNYIKEWCKKHRPGTWIEQSQELVNNMQKCFQRPGSLLIFTRELPHNIFPNDSLNFRYAQYLRMTPESSLMLTAEQKQIRKSMVKRMLPAYYNICSQICREIFMLDQ